MHTHPKPAGPPVGHPLEFHKPPQWELSGPHWVNRYQGVPKKVEHYPEAPSIEALKSPFRESVKLFLDALHQASAEIHVVATYRPPQRAYLMYYAYRVAKKHLDPSHVPPYPGVPIRWLHHDPRGHPDVNRSVDAARKMVEAYGIVYEPAKVPHDVNKMSRHCLGLAIDMTITWKGDLEVLDGVGVPQTIKGTPRNGGTKKPWCVGHPGLHKVGASYGVRKLKSDPPHWSDNGH